MHYATKTLIEIYNELFFKIVIFSTHKFKLCELNYFESSVAVTVIIITLIDSGNDGAVSNHRRIIDRGID